MLIEGKEGKFYKVNENRLFEVLAEIENQETEEKEAAATADNSQ